MNMNLFGFIFISLAFSESILSTKGMGLCGFANKFPCKDNGGSFCFKSPGWKKINHTKTLGGTQPTTRQSSDNRLAPDIASTVEQLIDHSTSDYVASDQATTDQLTSPTVTCPPNMVYANCSTCQATCMDPKGCMTNCTEPEMCVCPNGFLLNGDGCVPAEECECFDKEVGVIPEGASYALSNCSRRCSCSRGQLDCGGTYRCSPNAVCEVRNDVQKCYCNKGYEGDGLTCAYSLSDCLDVYNTISTESKVYKIKPTTWQGEPFDVYCDMTDGGGWTVFQRRVNGSQSFFLPWSDYKVGFGSPIHELWLGNDKLHSLTTQKNYELRVDVVDRMGDPYYVKYVTFSINDEVENYRLILGKFSEGDAGDGLSFNNGNDFTTRDRDNDDWKDGNCAVRYADLNDYCGTWCNNNGAWWYKDDQCGLVNINGPYGSDCFRWFDLPGIDCKIKSTEMKVRPN